MDFLAESGSQIDQEWVAVGRRGWGREATPEGLEEDRLLCGRLCAPSFLPLHFRFCKLRERGGHQKVKDSKFYKCIPLVKNQENVH